ncbi:hypothetical protein K438DRAFT_1990967 [Mycena galopus ATCC 62051]|nr:hypothetical protein K438DRAFT_1990967 [Mycena galopus ATCC 62051]
MSHVCNLVRPDVISVANWSNAHKAALDHYNDLAEKLVPLREFPEVVAECAFLRDLIHKVKNAYKKWWGSAKGDWDTSITILRDFSVDLSAIRATQDKEASVTAARNCDERKAALAQAQGTPAASKSSLAKKRAVISVSGKKGNGRKDGRPEGPEGRMAGRSVRGLDEGPDVG